VTIHERLDGTVSMRYGPHVVGRFDASGASLQAKTTKEQKGCLVKADRSRVNKTGQLDMLTTARRLIPSSFGIAAKRG